MLDENNFLSMIPEKYRNMAAVFMKMMIKAAGSRPVFSVPCVMAGRMTGALNCVGYRTPVSAWSGEKKKIVVEAARIITAAMETRKAYDEVRANEEKYRALFDAMDDAVFVLSRDTKKGAYSFVAVNRVTCDYLGYTEKELLSIPPVDVKMAITAQEIRKKLDAGFRAGSLYVTTDIYTKAGIPVPAEILGTVSNWGQKKVLICVARDISERKKSAEKQELALRMNAARAEIWKAAADKEITVEALAERLVRIVGSAVGAGRAAIGITGGGKLSIRHEWRRHKGIKPLYGFSVSADMYERFGLKRQAAFTGSADKLIKTENRKYIMPVLRSVLRKYGLDKALLTPFEAGAGSKGLIICSRDAAANDWNELEKGLVTDAAEIISRVMRQKDAEYRRKKLSEISAARAEIWKMAGSGNTCEKKLIQGLLEKVGKVTGSERVVFGEPQGDRFVISLEWKDAGVKKKFSGYSFPRVIYERYALREQEKVTPDSVLRRLSPGLKALFYPFVSLVKRVFGSKPSLVTPFFVEGRMRGILINTPVAGKQDWEEDEKQLLTEAALIISTVISRGEALNKLTESE
ncbi:MAG TPA: PAS domain S-box protein, partial [Candidatus Goldiibacteriota bacterium]|nr:PAS domain S-box protein [Candidatus Goldiibacteriota bacterium]